MLLHLLRNSILKHSFLILMPIPVPTSSHLATPTTFPTPLLSIHSSKRVRSPMGSKKSLAHHFEAGLSPPYVSSKRYSSKENGLQKDSSNTRSHRLSKLLNCYPHSEGLDWSYSGSSAVSPESLSSY